MKNTEHVMNYIREMASEHGDTLCERIIEIALNNENDARGRQQRTGRKQFSTRHLSETALQRAVHDTVTLLKEANPALVEHAPEWLTWEMAVSKHSAMLEAIIVLRPVPLLSRLGFVDEVIHYRGNGDVGVSYRINVGKSMEVLEGDPTNHQQPGLIVAEDALTVGFDSTLALRTTRDKETLRTECFEAAEMNEALADWDRQVGVIRASEGRDRLVDHILTLRMIKWYLTYSTEIELFEAINRAHQALFTRERRPTLNPQERMADIGHIEDKIIATLTPEKIDAMAAKRAARKAKCLEMTNPDLDTGELASFKEAEQRRAEKAMKAMFAIPHPDDW